MKKPSRKTKPAKVGALVVMPSRAPAHESSFREVVSLIQRARQRAFQAVNTELIDLYWRVGEYISRKLEAAEWGDGVVDELARYLARQHPDLKGFTRRSLFRMRQFHDTYRRSPKLAPLVRELPWTHHLMILSRCKRAEEREFYLRFAVRERWPSRELERQLNGALFERAVLSPPKVSALLTQIHPAAETIFKDTYLLDFLDLPEDSLRSRPPGRARWPTSKNSSLNWDGIFPLSASNISCKWAARTSSSISCFTIADSNASLPSISRQTSSGLNISARWNSTSKPSTAT